MAARYLTIRWEQLHRDALALAARLKDQGPFAGIVAVSRGGLVPAAILARELECRVVETVSVRTYEAEMRGEPVVTKPPAAAGNGAGWLLIDDMVDSGTTARVVRKLLPAARFAVLYAKPQGRDLADLFAADVDQETWIVFPWDQEPPPG